MLHLELITSSHASTAAAAVQPHAARQVLRAVLQGATCSGCCDGEQVAPLLCGVGCRWRKLEGSDPSTYEMIQKIQTLQKRLIGRTEEVVEKDLLIQVMNGSCDKLMTVHKLTGNPATAAIGWTSARSSLD